MKIKKSFTKKILSLFLALTIILGVIPTFSMTASADSYSLEYKADPATINDWKEWFSKNSNRYSGGIFLDKTVYTGTDAVKSDSYFADIADKLSFGTDKFGNENFLVSLSAIGSNTEILGYSATPTDTILVLDVSDSMSGNDAAAMVTSTNRAIEKLLALNNHNRVGVVLYSGNSSHGSSNTSTGTVILPLGRYTTTVTETVNEGTRNNPKYVTHDVFLTHSNDTVSVAYTRTNTGSNNRPNWVYTGVKAEGSNDYITGSKNVTGGTYIQNGLSLAYKAFPSGNDTVIPDGQIQAGTQRLPIIVLMSDGAPTTATTSYANVGTSDAGSGATDDATASVGFLTQATASWVKANLKTKYNGEEPRFYTLGLGTSNSATATGVLNPESVANNAASLWTDFLGTNKKVNLTLPVTSNSNNTYSTTVSQADNTVLNKNYVDQYWAADNADDMTKAFEEIVEEIIIQSRYYATLVTSNNHEIDGFISFTDEIGGFMEVKDIKGIHIGEGSLVTGGMFAEYVYEDKFVDSNGRITELGIELIDAFKTRFNITDTQSYQLLNNAVSNGFISWNDTTKEFSNYVAWYADENNDYIQPYNALAKTTAPDGAKYLVKSYVYLGDITQNHVETSMLYTLVRVREDLTTGVQVVDANLPAALLPMVTYTIEVEGDTLTENSIISMTNNADEKSPACLLYEVGLKDNITPYNITETIPAGYPKNDDGTYSFYSNRWKIDATTPFPMPINDNIPTGVYNHELVGTTDAHFIPSLQNERYYYTNNTTVLRKDGDNYIPYTGSKPSGDGYYHAFTWVETNSPTSKPTLTTIYNPITAKAAADAVAGDNNTWVIPAGTPKRYFGNENHDGTPAHTDKTTNATQTLGWSNFPASIHETNGSAEGYHVYGYLGNNGKITVAPAQGIKLSKTVSETVTGAPNSFTFEIALTAPTGTVLDNQYSYRLEKSDGTVETGEKDVVNNVITVTIGANDVIYIADLPTGTRYSVTENYIAQYVGVSNNSTGTIAEYTLSSVDFVNTPRGFGSLVVEKDVTHPFGTTAIPTELAQKEFGIEVKFEGNNNDLGNIKNNKNITSLDGNKTFVFTLTDGTDILFYDIPEGVTYTVSEPTLSDGFTLTTDANELTGTIANNTQSEASLVNDYAPQAVTPDITLTGTKTLDTWNEGEFQVYLQPVNIGGADHTNEGDPITIGTMKKDGKTYTFNMGNQFTYTKVGTYSYEIYEYEPATGAVPNVAYDKSFGLFTVTVTDNDIDGNLEVSNVTVHRESAALTGNATGGWTITKDFVNLYQAETVTFSVEKTINGSADDHEYDSGILFGLFDSNGPDDEGPNSIPNFYALTNDDGIATFGINVLKDDYITPKTYYLREIPPLLENRVVGMTYDTAWKYKVTIDWSGTDLAYSFTDMNDNPVAAADLKINNTYDTTNAYTSLSLSGKKTLEGRNIKDGEFTFNLYGTGANFTVTTNAQPLQSVKNTGTNKDDIIFDAIEFTSTGTKYYVISEMEGTAGGVTYDKVLYHITVNVRKDVDANGKTVLVKDTPHIHKVGFDDVEANQINFNNIYKIDDLEEVVIKGTKNLSGRDLIAGEFEFGLYEKGSSTPIEIVKNVGNRTFTFSALKFTEPTSKEYEVKEIVPADKKGVSYDTTVFTVKVDITDDGNGKLNKSVKIGTQDYNDGLIVFNNSYSSVDSDPIKFSGTKTLENRDLIDGEFKVNLYETASDFLLNANQQPLSVKSIAKTGNRQGAFEFSLNYTATQVGTHYYVVSEQIPTERYGVSYDAREYNITVIVLDNGVGKIIANISNIVCPGITGKFENNELNFTNSYNSAPATYAIKGHKDLEGKDITADMFEFELSNSEGVIGTVKNDANGDFAFPEVELGSVGTHTFYVKELNGGSTIKGIYYDSSIYTVNIAVKDNGVGSLIIENPTTDITYSIGSNSATGILFENTYSAAATDSIKIDGKKTLKNRNPQAEEFEFELYKSDENGNLNGDAISTAKNKADNTFEFDKELTFDKAQDYYYAVIEKDTNVSRVTYDDTKFLVKVTVKDGGEGKLYVDGITYKADGDDVQSIEFVNIFTPKPDDIKVNLTAKKTVKNVGSEKIGPEDFEFVLKNTLNNEEIKVKSDKDGLAIFNLNFTEEDIDKTYTYKLYETNDKRDNVTYSTKEYDVTIKVSLGTDNKLVAVITSDGAGFDKAEFENIYDYTPTPEPEPKPEPKPEPQPETPKSPQTGDRNNFSMLLAILFVSGLGIIGKSFLEIKKD